LRLGGVRVTPAEIESLAISKAYECELAAKDILAVEMNISSEKAHKLVNYLVRAAMYRCSAALVPK
jgi:hypothetical protein